MKMKFNILLIVVGLIVLSSCNKDPEALSIQNLIEKSDEYYANLRAWKKTPHQVSYFWYEAYAPLEGVGGYKDPASWGERIIGLPDSIDIVSLWMGIPSNDPRSPGYAPVAYADWKYTRKVKGTRFVATNIVRLNHTIKIDHPLKITYGDGFVVNLMPGDTVNFKRISAGGSVFKQPATDDVNDSIKVDIYTDWMISQVNRNELDGLDLDYEPEGDRVSGPLFTRMVKRAAKYFGPTSDPALNPEGKIFCIDFFQQYPPTECGQYVDYFIRQAYTWQHMTNVNASSLQDYYNACSGAIPPSKFIVTENLGSWYDTGGAPFTEVDGNQTSIFGGRMHTLEGMARWNPTQGKKGGFGGFYVGRSYYASKGPYVDIYRAIQAANPAGK